MLKLKLQYFSHLKLGANSLEKTLMLEKIESSRRMGQQRMRLLNGITDPLYMNVNKLGDSEGQGSLACCSPWGGKDLDMTEQLNHNRILSSIWLYQFTFPPTVQDGSPYVHPLQHLLFRGLLMMTILTGLR